jgi:hypothetical protein
VEENKVASFLSVLKAIAKGIGIVAGISTGVQSVVSPYLPAGAQSFLSKAVNAVVRAEQASNVLQTIGASVGGQGKLAIADAFFADALDIAELVSSREIGDNEKYKRGVAAIAAGRQQVLSGVADVLDSLKQKD